MNFEFQQIIESLQEGILVVQDNVITFKNNLFASLFTTDEEEFAAKFMAMKIFKVYRETEEEKNNQHSLIG